jgi:hypothetical protein
VLCYASGDSTSNICAEFVRVDEHMLVMRHLSPRHRRPCPCARARRQPAPPLRCQPHLRACPPCPHEPCPHPCCEPASAADRGRLVLTSLVNGATAATLRTALALVEGVVAPLPKTTGLTRALAQMSAICTSCSEIDAFRKKNPKTHVCLYSR